MLFLHSYNFIVRPQILTNPSDITIFIGESARLTCRALGTDIVYQWMKDGMMISRANSRILRIDNIMESHEGVYKCVVSNSNDKGGTVESNPASITVYGEYKLYRTFLDMQDEVEVHISIVLEVHQYDILPIADMTTRHRHDILKSLLDHNLKCTKTHRILSFWCLGCPNYTKFLIIRMDL